MGKKEKLQEIVSRGHDARRELHDIEEAERAKKNSSLVGRCFKYRNSYSAPSKGWWLYAEVIGVEGSHFRYLTFQECENGIITVETKEYGYSHLQQTAITKQEYDKQFRLLLDKLEALYQGGT
jgi:hypothetical protein